MDHPNLIDSAEQILHLAAELNSQPLIGFDTEFIRESSFFPTVELIQIATENRSWLVDARAFKKNFKPGPTGGFDPGITPLLEVFQNPGCLKILHAAQGDQECLYTSFGMLASPTLDTAVAASLCGLGEGIGLAKLLKQVLSVQLNKGHTRTNWAQRPLPSRLAEYARSDVEYLVPLAQELLVRLEKFGRKKWALELSAKWEDKAAFEMNVEEQAAKTAKSSRLSVSQKRVFLELLKWREKRVRELNVPRRWLADDTVLLDLVFANPRDLEHLGTFRGLNKSEIKKSGEEILGALKRTPTSGVLEEVKSTSWDSPSAEEAQMLELVRCYLNVIADRLQISVKHLFFAPSLLEIVRRRPKSLEELEALNVISQPVLHMIGSELIAFVHGNMGMRIGPKGLEIFACHTASGQTLISGEETKT